MLHTDAQFSKAIEDAVARIEQTTHAELIVVAASRSGTYRDLALLWASVGALVAMVILIVIPIPINPAMLVVEVTLTWMLLAWILDGAWFVRWLAPKKRQLAQVHEAAHAEFHREGVHATPARTGVLIYVSALEGRIEVLPDLGIQGRVPPARWQSACDRFSDRDLPTFLAALDGLGALLAEKVPPQGGEIVDLPNVPRIRA